MIIYPQSSRIPVEIGSIKVWVGPLTFGQKMQLQECVKMKAGKEIQDSTRIAYLTIKFAVKSIEGVTLPDGSPYSVSLGSDSALSDESVDELLQLNDAPSIVRACSLLAREIKEHEIPGVKIDLKNVKDGKKKEA